VEGTLAVVDLKRIASESEAGKNIEKKISEINEASKKDLIELETRIKSMEEDKKISEIDSRKIEDMQLILYDMVRTKRYQISEAYKKAFSILEREIYNVVSEVAKSHGIKMVITLDAAVYVDKDCHDLTNQVIKIVNERCKDIEVTIANNNKPQ
jgi:Skp family chaperone for outer membrane proteins